MAASGINEHNEAQRKERVLMRKAQAELYMPKRTEGTGYAHQHLERPPSTYDQQVYAMRQSPAIRHDRESVDRRRRHEHAQAMLQDYSAKLPYRYSSKDYISQW